ncbi:winged helix-turn-helix transcriptional regulator, partial [Patescibacteria group bacterium]|nr:winged helix-turn-helix transcriptional regulator [Patescibacteria group bacterium]
GAIFGGIIVWIFCKKKGVPCQDSSGRGKKESLIKKQALAKSANKQKILELLADKKKIANNDVEKLLGVSDATTERYLDELEKEGKIKQVGKTGKHVYYQRK